VLELALASLNGARQTNIASVETEMILSGHSADACLRWFIFPALQDA
jgi:hypothetical protein